MSVRQRPGARRPANPPARDAESAPVTWLTAAELDSWLSLVRLMIWLPWCIDQQLRCDSDLAIVEYQVLAMLSQGSGPDHADELARRGHQRLPVPVVAPVPAPGAARPGRREPDSADRRFTRAILTDQGVQALAAAAPGHVAHVRSLVIDVLSSEQLRRVALAADRITSRIDTSAINQ